MYKKITITVVAIIILTGIVGISNSGWAASAKATRMNKVYDRDCLEGFITKYLDTMIAHNPGSLPVAAGVKFTEDCKEMKLGEGLWKNISGLTSYRRDILDVRQGVAVSFLVVDEAKSPVMLVMRLKIDNQKITEIETMVIRNKKEGMLFNLENLKTASETMTSFPAKEQLCL